MKVLLLSHTPQPEQVVAVSANLCYSKDTIEQTAEKFFDEKETIRLIKKLKI